MIHGVQRAAVQVSSAPQHVTPDQRPWPLVSLFFRLGNSRKGRHGNYPATFKVLLVCVIFILRVRLIGEGIFSKTDLFSYCSCLDVFPEL